MRHIVEMTVKFLIVIFISCKVNALPTQDTTTICPWNKNNMQDQYENFSAQKVGIPATYSETQTKIKPSQSSSTEEMKFKNYIYMKAGIGRNQYSKFKDGEDSIYVVKKPKIGFMYQAGIGHKFTKSIRGDLTFQYGSLEYKGKDDDYNLEQKIRLFSAIANIYYDIPIRKSFIIYLTGGIGIGNNRTSDLNDRDLLEKWKGQNKTNVVWNIGSGIKFNLIKRFDLDLSYRYLNLGEAKTKDNITPSEGKPKIQKITSHQLMMAIIYNF